MLIFFEVCFFAGALFTVLSFVLGHVFDISGTDTDFDVDTGIDIDLDTDIGGVDIGGADAGGIDAGDVDTSGVENSGVGGHHHLLPFKPGIIAVFITTFGGVGIITMKAEYNIFLVFAISLAIAFVAAYLLFRFIWVPLYKMQGTAVSIRNLVGVTARVVLGMNEASTGRIIYIVDGNTYSAPARPIEGEDIQKGEEVIICEIKNHIFYVSKS